MEMQEIASAIHPKTGAAVGIWKPRFSEGLEPEMRYIVRCHTHGVDCQVTSIAKGKYKVTRVDLWCKACGEIKRAKRQQRRQAKIR